MCSAKPSVYIAFSILFISSPPGEGRFRGEPDRRGSGHVGHHHVGGSSLQPDWVSGLGSGQERHRKLITTGGSEAALQDVLLEGKKRRKTFGKSFCEEDNNDALIFLRTRLAWRGGGERTVTCHIYLIL